jgi:catechol 2,3-dioxygenase-like lactoylglutathione lyase family enzyme
MITGAHALIYTKQAEATREFLRDILGFPHVDAGHGWLIFRLPPAELGVHPDENGGFHELHFMCDDLRGTMSELQRRGVVFTMPVTDQGYGLVTAFRLPDGTQMGLYQPHHPVAAGLPDPAPAKPAAKKRRPVAAKRRAAKPKRGSAGRGKSTRTRR